MSDLFLIDTSVWIEALRPDGLINAKEIVQKNIDGDRAVIAGIIMMELLGGAGTKKDYDELKADLEALDYLETTEQVWDKGAEVSFRLRKIGVTVPDTDILIASIALTYNCTLIHMNSNFELIGKYVDLKERRVV